MTVHELRTFFNSVRTRHFRYRAAVRRENDLRGNTQSANTKCFSGLPPSEHNGNGTENKYLRLISFAEKTARERRDLEEALADAMIYIAFLNDPAEFRVMKYRYVDFMKWDDIAAKMHYSRRQLTRIHSKALQHINEKMSHSDT